MNLFKQQIHVVKTLLTGLYHSTCVTTFSFIVWQPRINCGVTQSLVIPVHRNVFSRIITFKCIGHFTDLWKWCSVCPSEYHIHDMRFKGLHISFHVNTKLSFFWNLSDTASRFLKGKIRWKNWKQLNVMQWRQNEQPRCLMRWNLPKQVDSFVNKW